MSRTAAHFRLIVNGEATYAEFVNELNQRIENYNLVITQRQRTECKRRWR